MVRAARERARTWRFVAAGCLALLAVSVAPTLATGGPRAGSGVLGDALARSVGYPAHDSAVLADALLRRSFADELKAMEREPGLRPLRVERFYGDHVALLDSGGANGSPFDATAAFGKRAPDPGQLVQSPLPLRVGEGADAGPLDLRLSGAEQGLEPERPLVPVVLPRRIGEGAKLQEGEEQIAIGLAALRRPGAKAHRTKGGALLYPNARSDLDVIWAPRQVGAELLLQLRSRRSPSEQRIELSLPDGAELREAEGGAAEVVRDGEPLAGIEAPTAVDAAGADVPVSMEVDGSDVILTTDLRGARLPVLVDPIFHGYDWEAGGGNSGNIEDWVLETSPGSPFQTALSCQSPPGGCYGAPGNDHGLYLYAPPGQSYATGDFARASYTVARFEDDLANYGSRPTTYLQWADLALVDYHERTDTADDPTAVASLWGESVPQTIDSESIAGDVTNLNLPRLEGATQADRERSKRVQLELRQLGAAGTLGDWRDAYIGRAVLALDDKESPSSPALQFTDLPTTWVKNATYSVSASATDPGIGVKAFQYVQGRLGGAPLDVSVDEHPCTGQPRPSLWCPREWSAEQTLSTGILAEGVNETSVAAYDLLAKFTRRTGGALRIDRSAPEVTVSGPLTEQGTPGFDLHVDATDGSYNGNPNDAANWETARSGVKSIEVLVDGERDYYEEQPCPGAQSFWGSCPMAADWAFNPAKWGSDTEHEVTVVVTDQLGHETTKGPFPVLDDIATKPSGWMDERTAETTVWAHNPASDPDVPANQRGVGRIELTLPGGQVITRDFGCSPAGPCLEHRSAKFTYDTDELPEGIGTAIARGYRPDGVEFRSWETELRIDHSDPEQSVTARNGGASNFVEENESVVFDGLQDSSIVVNSTDEEEDSERSGVQSIEIRIDGRRVFHETQTCDTHSCPMDRTYAFDAGDYAAAVPHSAQVITTDYAASDDPDVVPPLPGQNPKDNTGVSYRQVVRNFEFTTVAGSAPPSAAGSHLGLEDYFHYDPTPTGAGGTLQTNLANGNLLWHKVPIVNPGRGLSTFLNLTYNSLAGPQNATPMATGSHDDLGVGFSAGISTLTRINEPLGGVAAGVAPVAAPLPTPPTITLTDPDGTRHLFRQRGGPLGNSYEPPPGVNLELRRFQSWNTVGENTPRAWGITRPDGVTYFFDGWGYARSIVDRNGNEIRYEYEKVDPTDGSSCADQAIVPGSLPEISCEPRLVRVIDPAGNDPGASPELTAARTLTVAYNPGAPISTGAAGKISQILDHGPRGTGFIYDSSGRLIRIAEAQGANVRFTHFGYGAGPLTTVSDSIAQQTRIEYVNGQVSDVVDRRSKRKTYAYGLPPQGGAATASAVTDAREYPTRFDFDAVQRPLRITDARGTQTQLAWDADSNVSSITEAAGAPEAATTVMGYDANGMLTFSRDPLGRLTLLGYRHSPGTQLSPTGTDSGGEFVSDLTAMRRPAGNTWTFELDGGSGDPADFKGNVTAQIDPVGARAETAYGPHGEVISERDPVGHLTTYPLADFDPNGLPQVKVDPRGNDAIEDGSDGRWVYGYDARGNVTQVTDPRGSVAGGPAAQPANWTTRLTYDTLDRLTHEDVPKDPADAPGVFMNHRRDYDRNDNVTAVRDALGLFTRMTYNKTDQLLTQTDAKNQITTNDYDAVGNLIETRLPRGNLTRYAVDEIGRKVVEQRLGLDEADLFTSYAYDRRDNLVGMVDPIGNAATDNPPFSPLTPAKAQANAQNAVNRRFTYINDLAGNRRFEIENADGAGAFTTEYRYDANDNRTELTEPRGFEPGAERGDFTTRYRYDRRDEVSEVEDPFGGVTSYERRADGMVTSETSPNGNETSLPGDYTTDYTYFPTGEVKTRSIPWSDQQYGRTNPDLDALQVSYGRDAVGNPLQITDARGNSFANAFFHTGELKETARPSWWMLDYSGGGTNAGMPDPGVRFAGTGAGAQADTELAVGGPKLVERSGYESQQSGGGGADPSQPASPTDFGRVDPEALPSMLPAAGPTSFAYDSEMRLNTVTDAAGKLRGIGYNQIGQIAFKYWQFKSSPDIHIIHSFAYDRNGNLTTAQDSRTDQPLETSTWNYAYDEFDRPIEETAPGATSSPSGDLLTETTKLAYDANGNLTRRITPRGPAFDFNFAYDGADRLVSEENPAEEAWTYAYDSAGNRTTENSPRNKPQQTTYDALGRASSHTDLAGETTSFAYDANGNRNRVISPGASESPNGLVVPRITTTTYDGRDLPWKTTTGSPLGSSRTTITEYDPNGNLRRTVNPKGVDGAGEPEAIDTGDASAAAENATVNIYSPDNLLIKSHLPWSGTADKRYLQAFKRDVRGRVDAVRAPHEGNEQAPTTCYKHYETGWIRSSSDQQLVGSEQNNCPDSLHEHQITYDYDRRGNQTLWESRSFGQSLKGRKVVRDFFPNGTLRQRKAISFAGPNQTENSVREYNYHYNANRSLVLFFDRALKRETHVTRDPAERERAVNERWAVGRDTLYTYDPSGNVATVRTDGIWGGGTNYDGGKTTAFQYDNAERETKATVIPPAGQGSTNRVTDTAYHPSGEISTRVRSSGPGADEAYFFNPFGEISRMRREKSGTDDLVKNQGYDYDANGNRTTDERGFDYDYNARDQMIKWDRATSAPHAKDDEDGPSTDDDDRVEYDVNGSGAILEKRDLGTEITTEFDYPDGDKLTRTITTDASEDPEVTTTTDFTYDDFGEMRTAVSNSTEPGAETSTTFYDYDEFERRTGSRTKVGTDPAEHEATYAHDGLDRRDTRTELNGAGAADDETFEYSYVGTSESLAREVKLDGTKLRTYDYDSRGDRRGQYKGGSFRAYAKDANGSVEGVEEADGELSEDDSYDYDPYGELEVDDDAQGDPQDAEEELSDDAKENPFRFEGFYYDSGVKTYDMQARSYRPEIGRFTTQDRYAAASSDLELQSDPLTQNRYAFAGGNPVSRIEFDGHCNYAIGGVDCKRKYKQGKATRIVYPTRDGGRRVYSHARTDGPKDFAPTTDLAQRLTAVETIHSHPVFGASGPDLDWSEIKQTSTQALQQAVGSLDRFHEAYSESQDGTDPGATLRTFGTAVEMFAINAEAAAAGRGNPLGQPLGKLATRLTVVAGASDFVAGLQAGESFGASGREAFVDVGSGWAAAKAVGFATCTKAGAGCFLTTITAGILGTFGLGPQVNKAADQIPGPTIGLDAELGPSSAGFPPAFSLDVDFGFNLPELDIPNPLESLPPPGRNP